MIRFLLRMSVLTCLALQTAGGWGHCADRALLVGIDRYADPRVPGTPGCVADAEGVAALLKDEFGFAADGIRILRNAQATAAAVETTFRQWLVDGTGPGDRVFFLYSGHGSQLPDDNGDDRDDGKDETLAPYDVNPETGANEIRDDVFEELISRLSGRRAVLVFDSCHSGTISRGLAPKLTSFPRGGGARWLPPPEQFRSLQATRAARSADTTESYAVTAAAASTRDLYERDFIEGDELGRISGVVVISAAAAWQQAFPIEIDGSCRGALSLALERSVRGSSKTLDELRRDVTATIASWREKGQLEGNQTPQFEAISVVPLEGQPLFGSWEAAAAAPLFNPLSQLRINIATADGKKAYQFGEKATYRIQAGSPGYLYLLVFSQNNVATCIFPNSHDRENYIQSGTLELPRSCSPAYEFPVGEPAGRDVVVALLASQRLNLEVREDPFTWREIHDRLQLRKLQDAVGEAARTRGQSAKKTGYLLPDTDWQSAFIVVEARP